MALSDQLTELAGRTKKVEEAAAATRTRNVAKLEEQRTKLQSNVDALAQGVSAKAAETRGGAQAWWAETAAKIEQRRAEMKAKREQQKAQQTVEAAKRYADSTEEQATVLISLAEFAVDVAAEAAVDAAIAAERADAMQKEHATVTK